MINIERENEIRFVFISKNHDFISVDLSRGRTCTSGVTVPSKKKNFYMEQREIGPGV
jgi:hypothetical protein